MPEPTALQPAEESLASLLATLRQERRQQSGLSRALVPPSAERAYAIAERVRERLGWAGGGWKIAAFKAEMQRPLRTDAPIYGRVYAPFIQQAPLRLAHRELLHPVVEAELMVRLGAPLPPREAPYTADDMAPAVASLHVGIEVAECRFAHDAAFPSLAAIQADGCGSGSLAVGAPIEGWRSLDLAALTVVLQVDGQERRRGTVETAIGHPLEPLAWLATALSRRGIGLQAGEIVSTGTLTGMVLARAGETHLARFGDLGEVRVEFSA